jgi:hypothetical protein
LIDITMAESITLNPSMKALLPVFKQRCAAIKERQNGSSEISIDLIRELRATFVTPLTKPRKAEQEEELQLLATLSVVIDLLTQGWRISNSDPVILELPEWSSIEEEKARIRLAHLIDRDAHMTELAVKEFVRGMEKRRLTSRGWHSIFSVMRDGEELAQKLRPMLELDNEELQADLLARTIKPYIQVAETDVVCEHTGLKLNEIWRYFRHTWVTSYKSVPGRSMMILIRDSAAPNHPVIGIANLASSVVQQLKRDEWIGWDGTTVVDRFEKSEKPKTCVRWLLSELDTFIEAVYRRDLIREGIIARSDIRRPKKDVIDRLLKDSAVAIKKHRIYPDSAKHKSAESTEDKKWAEQSETALFRSKRSKQLATMLSIRNLFQKLELAEDISVEKWQKLFKSASFKQAIRQIVRLVKAERVGVAMMDISICGAIAPYNVLLGGKLVALLLCSPEIVKEYEDRYGSQMSLIASSMRGASVTRSARLVLLCTTSLYGASLNQYSRLKLPAPLIGGKENTFIEYKCVGVSLGYGSFHFSKDSLRMMDGLIARSKESRKVNSIFGEGVNPLMRKIREGLGVLGLPDDALLNHGSKRVVYVVALASNFRDFLLGLSETPRYVLPMTRLKHRTELIADYWRQRWLLKRIMKPGLLDEVARHTCIYPIRHGAQVQMPSDGETTLDLWAVADAAGSRN